MVTRKSAKEIVEEVEKDNVMNEDAPQDLEKKLYPFLAQAKLYNLKKSKYDNFRFWKEMDVGDTLAGIYIGNLITDYGKSLVIQRRVTTDINEDGFENIAIPMCRSLQCLEEDHINRFIKIYFDSWGQGQASKRKYKRFDVIISQETFEEHIMSKE